jgi:hypothetical protein
MLPLLERNFTIVNIVVKGLRSLPLQCSIGHVIRILGTDQQHSMGEFVALMRAFAIEAGQRHVILPRREAPGGTASPHAESCIPDLRQAEIGVSA